DKSEYKAYNHRKRMLAAAGSSALFVPILAPAYISKEKYTLKELDAFCTNCLDEERIIIIEIYPVSDQRPAAAWSQSQQILYRGNAGRGEHCRAVESPGGEAAADRLRRASHQRSARRRPQNVRVHSPTRNGLCRR